MANEILGDVQLVELLGKKIETAFGKKIVKVNKKRLSVSVFEKDGLLFHISCKSSELYIHFGSHISSYREKKINEQLKDIGAVAIENKNKIRKREEEREKARQKMLISILFGV